MMERLYCNPSNAFADNWPGWGAFLGTGKIFRMPEEWVLIAEEMAHKNGGVLQSKYWLETNGFSGLYHAMKNHPDLFVHIEQEKPQGRFRSPEEWVTVAEELARKNGGVLQYGYWLRINGFSAIVHAKRRRPELFAHIKQEKPKGYSRSPEEWVTVAEEIARENGGVLQSREWLTTNGFSGLATALRKRHELFIHIKQEIRGSHGHLIGYRGGEQAAEPQAA